MSEDKAKRAPINTEKQDPAIHLAEAMIAGSASRFVEAQEARGQQSFVNSDTLPIEMSPEDRVMLESEGVKFGDVVPDDSLFQYVELPVGWKKVPTDHDMWSDLVDETGKKRAMIFYKAAFYDRRAHLSIVR